MVKFKDRNQMPDKLTKMRETENKFRKLYHQILEFATSDFPWIDFLKEISSILVDFSNSDTIILWLTKENEKHKYKEIKSSKNSFSFRIVSEKSNKNIEARSADSVTCSFYNELFNGKPDSNLPWLTKSGSLWINDIEDLYKENIKTQSNLEYLFNIDKKNYQSILFIPINVGIIKIGVIQIMSRKKNFLTKEEIKYYEEFVQTMGLVIINQRAQAALRERVKELTCLYGISQAVEKHGTSLENIFNDTANLLPPAWQYPSTTQARILIDGVSYTTPGYKIGVHCQKADIMVKNKIRGQVEVWYTIEKFHLDEGPFLKEERHLINTIAKELALIIERKEAERDKIKLEGQLRHADRLATVGQLTAGVAHELNEPLGNILGFSQLAMKCPKLPHQAKMDIEKIITASLYSREVIKKLMLFTRQAPAKMIKVDLNQVVEDGLYFLESRCNQEGIEVVRSLLANLPKITADSAQLQQVLVNLVVNSIHAMPDGGTLTIKTHGSDNHVSLFVEDTGIGIKKELVKQIFIPFFTTKDIGEGTGLGLAVVHGIVASHGGTINVWSEVGQGTRFNIQFPVTEFLLIEEK